MRTTGGEHRGRRERRQGDMRQGGRSWSCISAEGFISFSGNPSASPEMQCILPRKDAFPSAEILQLKDVFPSSEILPLGDVFPSAEMNFRWRMERPLDSSSDWKEWQDIHTLTSLEVAIFWFCQYKTSPLYTTKIIVAKTDTKKH